MKFRRTIPLLLAAALCFGAAGCAKEEPETAQTEAATVQQTRDIAAEQSLTILYTNDVHAAFSAEPTTGEMGYAALAAYRAALEAEGRTVLLIDGGDALESGTRDTAIRLMNEAGYAFAVPGACELCGGVSALVYESEHDAQFTYLCCNLTNTKTGKTVFSPYRIVECGGVKIALLGVVSPEALPQFVRDTYDACGGPDGEALSACVQKAVDAARSEGAKYVVGIGCLGTEPSDSPYTSVELIAATTGMDVFLDARSHSLFAGETVTDKDGKEVPLCSTGTRLTAVGQIVIDAAADTVSVALIDGLTEEDAGVLKLLPEDDHGSA